MSIEQTAAEPQKQPDEPMLKFFKFEHLQSEKLRDASRPFCELARLLVVTLPRNAERTVALRKLLEAKDCAVRSLLDKSGQKARRTALAAS